MPTPVSAVTVLIASPGDTAEERAALRRSLSEWNENHTQRTRVALIPWLYEHHAVPMAGDRPQALINAQAVDRADVVIALFNAKLGSHTGEDVSGTAEEIKRASANGKPVHVYFSTAPIPRDHDPEQLAKLNEYKEQFKGGNLYGAYEDVAELVPAVIRSLEHDIAEQEWATPQPSAHPRGAQLKWRHERTEKDKGINPKNGKRRISTTANRLIVENESNTPAENLTFTVTPLDTDPQLLSFDQPETPVTIHGDSRREWRLVPVHRMNLEIQAQWSEAGKDHHGTWTITTE